ncbi:MAG: SGNH/GDSL hydrolase family protein [Planctomycetota bacterium]
MSRHVVLVGDSIFDNALYVPGGPSVTEHVGRLLSPGDRASLVAVDGATVSSVFRQIERVPDDATHLILSAGGNDALWTAGNIFSEESTDIRSSLQRVDESVTEFAKEYRRLVDELREFGLPLTLCTVYDSVPGLDLSEVAGLCVFNDTISRTAISVGATLIDLRTICAEKSDYSETSPIEPSASGGGKIARAIIQSVMGTESFHRVIGS